MKAEFNGKVYLHEMIAERQREVWVGVTALRMMQEHHGNRYFSFKCVSPSEEAEWLRKADAIAPPVRMEGAASLSVLTETEIAALCGGEKAARRLTHKPR